MIFANMETIHCYKNLSAGISKAIAYILSHDLSELPMGTTTIYGKELFVNKVALSLKEERELPFEVHNRYYDIHVILSGKEKIRVKLDVSGMREMKSYDEEADYALYEGDTLTDICLASGDILICLNGEYHKPGIKVDKNEESLKCIFKVRAD